MLWAPTVSSHTSGVVVIKHGVGVRPSNNGEPFDTNALGLAR